jgi:branched-chain amino acid transport system ATP-binding protein
MKPVLEVIDLHYYYGNIHAVKGISLYVNEGEIVTLIGANGAGKTTTLQAISGLINPKGIRGKILFNGKEIQGKSGNEIAALGITQALEGRQIFSKLTVEENLEMGGFLRKDKKEVRRDIEKVYLRFPRLLERCAQLGGTLSGGEQQMLAIGRALIGKPKLMLLDEPSLGLAPLIVEEIFAAIQQISNEGTTILFVEQNSYMALTTAQRGYVMQTGEMIMSGKSEVLINDEEIRKAYLGL